MSIVSSSSRSKAARKKPAAAAAAATPVFPLGTDGKKRVDWQGIVIPKVQSHLKQYSYHPTI